MTRDDWKELGRCFVPHIIGAAVAVPLTYFVLHWLIGGVIA